MLVALGVDAKQLAIFSHRAQKEMKGAEFSVQRFQGSRQGNQTPPTIGNHGVPTQLWLACS